MAMRVKTTRHPSNELRDRQGNDIWKRVLGVLESRAATLDIHVHDPAGHPIAHSRAELRQVVEDTLTASRQREVEVIVAFRESPPPKSRNPSHLRGTLIRRRRS